ncbi:MAG TPA: phosphoribosylglycinamide formyltransferase [Clostridia bacterium]|nr:phosphoribosylglycinamide formyltransferase [Clostridia bacterium]
MRPLLRIAVLASGRGTNLQALIEAQNADRLGGEIVLVVSDNPQAKALERASRHGIPTRVIEPAGYATREGFDRALVETLQAHRVELVVLAGYMRLLSPVVLQAYPQRVINIHPSLLPSFPGLNAQEQAWKYGVKYTGCTVHFVDEGMDTGPIIAQRVVAVNPEDTADDLAAKILQEEHRLYPQVVRWLAEGRVVLQGRRVLIKESDGC